MSNPAVWGYEEKGRVKLFAFILKMQLSKSGLSQEHGSGLAVVICLLSFKKSYILV